MSSNKTITYAVFVRWGPNDGYPAGIRVWRRNGDSAHVDEQFIPWAELKIELERTLLPQLFANAHGYAFKTVDYHGKKDWLVKTFDQSNQVYCDLWLGGNPESNWEVDGLVRVGDPYSYPFVWQTYQRYSDGTYLLIASRCATIDEMARHH